MAGDGRVGVVRRLSAKPKTLGQHGLPKPSIGRGRLSHTGVVGDFNLFRETEKHGDPGMALVLLPMETLEDLRREGWPVRPGDLGENITTEGILYADLAPPRRLRIGAAEAETTGPCDPCDNLYLLPYVGKDRGPAFLKATLGRRGWYARVTREGQVAEGDAVELLD